MARPRGLAPKLTSWSAKVKNKGSFVLRNPLSILDIVFLMAKMYQPLDCVERSSLQLRVW